MYGGPAGESVMWELKIRMKEYYQEPFPLGDLLGRKFFK